ncbi:PREDICTED: uncharacterized protein LOC106808794 [Priapulus caudatus]|uniref:Uncharacterized protein LOC106808794 n=1 Tax=Priapulus caudatus TaxID=37621 RepID=A0ABM1E4L2_PRICU|nr:PREDICTED: uncharacterized protein LOC106808794 [Priapulus caudatus]
MISEQLGYSIDRTFYWTDSASVLRYIANRNLRFHTFVANRLAVIHEATQVDQWHYVNTKQNPADCASRGMAITNFVRHSLWLNGPDFLWKAESEWPSFPQDTTMTVDDAEVKKMVNTIPTVISESCDGMERLMASFSDWSKLKRITGWLMIAMDNLRLAVKWTRQIKIAIESYETDPLTCERAVEDDVMKDKNGIVPNTSQEWKQVAVNFYRKWNYPFCLGALDGKHVAIRQPCGTGSEFFNYKHFFSVVLFALTDADYRFLYVNVGSTGRSGDAGIFRTSSLLQAMQNQSLDFPPPENTPVSDTKCNYHIIGDDAFPLRPDLMKPYPHKNLEHAKRIFNYRLSRARRVVENSFGILANRFRVFLAPIALEPDFVENLILAACCLHNFLIENQQQHL